MCNMSQESGIRRWPKFLQFVRMETAVLARPFPSLRLCPSVIPSHSDVLSRRMKLWSCSFQHLVGQSIYTVSQKNIPDVFSYKSRKYCRIFIIFGRNITEKVRNQKILYYPPRLINASGLPCETENMEIVSFHVTFSCWLTSRQTSHIGIII